MVCRACWPELFSCGRAAPGCGGRKLKSGGIVNGARDSTANSSGDVFSRPIAFFRSLQPAISTTPAKPTNSDGRRPPGTRNGVSSVMAQLPPHWVFLMRFLPNRQATRRSSPGAGQSRSVRKADTTSGHGPDPMQTRAIDSRHATGSHTLPRSDTLAAVFAALLGALVIWAVGFSHIQIAHNAAHDTRHSAGFPCH